MRGGSPWYRDAAVVAVALAVAAAWVFVSHPLEGPVLLTLSRDHGVHATDVLAATTQRTCPRQGYASRSP